MKNEIAKSQLERAFLIAAAWCFGASLAMAGGVGSGKLIQQSRDRQPSRNVPLPRSTKSLSSNNSHSKALKTIVVTGYARSLATALTTKFKAINMVSVISAEGIGQFPASNLAEALQRVTGVQITRNQGEGQYVSVEGLNPDFTDTLFNGRQLPSGSGTRAFDYQVLPSNFAEQVEVYKSPTANLPSAGLAATINIESLHPLTYGKEYAALTVQGVYDQQSRQGLTPNIEAIYTNTFFHHRLGWMIAANLYERNVDDQSVSTDGVLPDQTYTGPGTHYRIFGLHTGDQQGLDRRMSLESMVQLKINHHVELGFDTLDSEFDNWYNWYEGNNWYPGAFALGPETTLSETVSPAGVETAWSGTNVFSWLQANRYEYKQYLTSNALTANIRAGNWKVHLQGSYGQAREETTNLYVSWATRAPGASLYYNTSPDPGGPVSFGFVNGYNPENINNYYFFGQQGEYKAPTTDQIWQFQANASRHMHNKWVSRLQFGVNYKDRIFGNRPNYITNTNAGFPANMSPYLMIDNNPTFFSAYGGSASFPTSFLTVNLNKFYAAFPLSKFLSANPPTQVLTQTTRVEEREAAAYAQVLFRTPDKRLTGNLGVRLLHSQVLSSGFVPAPGAQLIYGLTGGSTSITYSSQGIFAHSNSYMNVLPDLNLTYRITADLQARFAAAQLLEQPDINLLGQSSVPNASAGPPPAGSGFQWVGTLSEGNPYLKPYRSNQFDVSLDWYFAPRSVLAGMFFDKHIMELVETNYFHQSANVALGAGGASGTSYSAGTVLPINFTVGQPVNARSTNLRGVEIAWQQPFLFLPGVLKYLGAQANYTHIWTQKVVLEQGQPSQPVTGVSHNTYNAGVYYDTGVFGLHANYTYRGSWIDSYLSFFGDGLYVKGYGQLDLGGDYHVNKWLTVNASVINATQSASQMVDRYGILRLYEFPGRRFYMGFTAQL
jgi:TonB-dependent receptor